MSNPFKELKVLDLSRYLVGGFATQLFAELGAEVIKVEDRHTGDYCRLDEPKKGGVSYYFSALCRNKKSLSVDLKSEEGRLIFNKLAAKADVIVENFRPGVTERLGIDYPTVSAFNNGIIYCSITGFGQKDPRSSVALHDINIQALSGYLSLNGAKTSPFHLVDMATWTSAAQAISLALYKREISGSGDHLDLSMFDCFMWWMSLLSSRCAFQDGEIGEDKIDYPTISYNIYETKDGELLSIGLVEEKFWKTFCGNNGLESLLDKQHVRPSEDPSALVTLQNKIKSRTLEEWMEALSGLDGCVAPVRKLNQVIDEISETNPDKIAYINHPEAGMIPQTALPFTLRGVDISLDKSTLPPELGADSREILKSLGFTDKEIEKFRKENVI